MSEVSRFSEQVRRPLATGLVLAAALSAGSPDAAAATPANPPSAAPQERILNRVKNRLERRVRHGLPVHIEANFDAYWRAPHAKGPKKFRKTEVPVTAEIAGKTRFFGVRQTGMRLGSLALKVLPEDVTMVQSPLTFPPEGPSRAPSIPILTDATRISLNSFHQPIAELDNLNGQQFIVPVGRTQPVRGVPMVF